MRALTLTQPWATLVQLGKKSIETRSWGTHYRGPLAIHAAAGLGPIGGATGLREIVQMSPFREVLSKRLYDIASTADRTWAMEVPGCVLPRGAIVAVVELIEVAPITDDGVLTQAGRLYPESPEHEFGDYTPGRYAWLLHRIQPLRRPVPCRGALGLWSVPADVQEQIRRQVEA
jgi:hypothetical protein